MPYLIQQLIMNIWKMSYRVNKSYNNINGTKEVLIYIYR